MELVIGPEKQLRDVFDRVKAQLRDEMTMLLESSASPPSRSSCSCSTCTSPTADVVGDLCREDGADLVGVEADGAPPSGDGRAGAAEAETKRRKGRRISARGILAISTPSKAQIQAYDCILFLVGEVSSFALNNKNNNNTLPAAARPAKRPPSRCSLTCLWPAQSPHIVASRPIVAGHPASCWARPAHPVVAARCAPPVPFGGKAAVMVKSNVPTKVVFDPSNSRACKPRSKSYASEKWNFMSGSLADMYRGPVSRESADQSDNEDEEMDIRKILKDIEYLGASNMSWKEKKQLENQKVVGLGGKPPKKHCTPLSVAKPAMKNQKKREQKKKEEEVYLSRFMKNSSKSNHKDRKLNQEDKVLRASEGHFRKGVLDVKHLLAPSGSKSTIFFSKKKTCNLFKSDEKLQVWR
ncbi:hypothetical protein Cni_G08691 [Canna indica]|uniref:Uncharacterized protein n=1 Tax=Canna indica TaxID=4628 RepID=A0AAQ3K0W1_9LILI|nr:hypothetical protein Cni_G08691 [Canna indica]